jgi:hypothetical protein
MATLIRKIGQEYGDIKYSPERMIGMPKKEMQVAIWPWVATEREN